MAHEWHDIIKRINTERPEDLDEVIAPLDPRLKPQGQVLAPADDAVFAGLTPLYGEETICFGARITAQTPDPVKLAMEVAQLAAEKSAEVVILSHVEKSGLERFGFRVETIGGEDDAARQRAEAELRNFWNIVVVI